MRELFYLNKYFWKYKWRLLLGVVFIVLSNIFGIFPAQIFRNAIDAVLSSVNFSELYKGSDLEGVMDDHLMKSALIMGAGILLMALIRGFFVFLMRQTIIIVSRLIEFDLKNEIFSQYLLLDTSFYKQNKVGDIMNRISEDVSKVRMYLGPAVMYTVNLIVLFVLVIATMFSINARLSVFVLIPLPVMSILIYYVSALINRHSEMVQRQLSSLFNISQETFSGIRILKAFGREDYTVDQFEGEVESYRQKSMGLIKVNALFHPIVILLPVLSTILTIYIGGKEVINGTLSYGNIAEYVIYINMLTWPVASLGWVTSLVQRAAASQKRINEFLREKPLVEKNGAVLPTFTKDVEFKNVTFIYPESGIKALDNISFKAKKGETLAILGRTGSGKSTITHLIFRLYDPEQGQVLVDGVDVKELDLPAFRQRIGYVPQDVFLFSDSIKNNIQFGLTEEQSDETVRKYAELADVADNIEEFTEKYETVIGERGITLSGGQKQRVSIARALIKKPELLILDDSLSAVDTETEERILNHIKNIEGGHSQIIISHRVSTVKHADNIIYLENGKIVEQGTHDELMEEKKHYYELYQSQLSNQNLP